jgi:hypothetical protein
MAGISELEEMRRKEYEKIEGAANGGRSAHTTKSAPAMTTAELKKLSVEEYDRYVKAQLASPMFGGVL